MVNNKFIKINSLNLDWKKAAWVFVLCCATEVSTVKAVPEALTIIAQSGVAGIVGASQYLSGDASGFGGSEDSAYDDVGVVAAIGTLANGCTVGERGYSGRYGLKVSTGSYADTGAVLLLDGTGEFSRYLKDGMTQVNGVVSYQQGRWVANWFPAVNGVSQAKSDDTGLSSNYYVGGGMRSGCPTIPGSWSVTKSRTSSVNVRFLLDAPSGGLQPGVYLFYGSVYLTDAARVGRTNGFFSGFIYDNMVNSRNVSIIAADYSCAIEAPGSVSLSNFYPTAQIEVKVQCSRHNTSASANRNVYLSVQASGLSRLFLSAEPRKLPVVSKGSGANSDMFILGSWASTPASSCSVANSDPIYFDGAQSHDKLIGNRINTTMTSYTQNAYFRLCPESTQITSSSGEYVAQAMFSVVQR